MICCILVTARLFSIVERELRRSEFHHSVCFITVDGEGLVILILVLDRADLEERMVSLRHRYPSSPVDLPSLVNLF